MTLPVISALNDSASGWRPEWAVRVLEREGVDAATLLASLEASLAPVPTDWLQKRLRLLWKSSSPANSLEANAWLHETGRLLMDLPGDILAEAIDTAVRQSLRGFMPTIGEIRAIAEPEVALRKKQAGRMRTVVHGERGRPAYPWESQEREIPEDERCSPEEAAAIMAKFKLGAAS
jgi:hypothetical protein